MIWEIWLIPLTGLIPLPVWLRKRQRMYLPSVFNGLLLTFASIGLNLVFPVYSLFFTVPLLLLLLLLPVWLQKRAVAQISSGQENSALKLLKLTKLLSPFFDLENCRETIQALHDSRHSDSPPDLSRLTANSAPAVSALILAHMYRADWVASLDWLEDQPAKKPFPPFFNLLKIRGLCETGRIREALLNYRKLRNRESHLPICQFLLLYLQAFGGRPENTEFILALQPESVSSSRRRYWKALSLYYNPVYSGLGTKELQVIKASEERRLRNAAGRHLDCRIPPPANCSEAVDESFSDFLTNYQDYSLERRPISKITLFLIILNTAVFLSLGDHVWQRQNLGLFVPGIFESREWWRLLTSTLIHDNAAHCFNNMLMLAVFGSLTEPFYKWRHFLLIYFGGGVSGMLFIALFQQGEFWILGASGSTMSLLGTYIALLISRNRKKPLAFRYRQLIFLCLLVLFQSWVDLSSPQISFTAHAWGLAFGLAFGTLFFSPAKPSLQSGLSKEKGVNS